MCYVESFQSLIFHNLIAQPIRNLLPLKLVMATPETTTPEMTTPEMTTTPELPTPEMPTPEITTTPSKTKRWADEDDGSPPKLAADDKPSVSGGPPGLTPPGLAITFMQTRRCVYELVQKS